jgi:hypothetical protein
MFQKNNENSKQVIATQKKGNMLFIFRRKKK